MKPIKNYEGLYSITEDGQVFSHISNKFLKTVKKIYEEVRLKTKDGKQKCHFIHRLVAETYIDNPNNYPCVNHKDENPLNNHVDNLE